MTRPFVSEDALLDLVYRGSMTGPFLTEEALLDLVFRGSMTGLFFSFFSFPNLRTLTPIALDTSGS